MFNFFSMAYDYESRKVARDEFSWGAISTASVNDGEKPYETAIKHDEYGDGKWIIVESYDTNGEAAKGHERWVEKMTAAKLPIKLTDCCNAGVTQILQANTGKPIIKHRAIKGS